MKRRKLEFQLCPECGQIEWKTAAQSAERHRRTIKKLFDYTPKQLSAKRGPPGMVQARQHYWFLLVIEDYWSLPRAGDETGHKHHAVLYGIRRFAVEHIEGCHFKMSIQDIRIAYYKQAGLSDEQIEELV